MNFKRLPILILLALLGTWNSSEAFAQQDSVENLTEKFDDVSYRWDLIAETLEDYRGLIGYCQIDSFRYEVISVLNDIHHYDTLIYRRLMEISYYQNNHEIKKTLEQIRQFEEEYSVKNFIHHLNKECKESKEVEHEKDKTLSDIGHNSYSGQMLNVENATFRYVHHVTKLVDHIRNHVHHLHVDDLSVTYGF